MTVTYSQTPGISVTLEAGSIQGIEVGETEKLVLFGAGDTTNGSASTNSPEQVSTKTQAENLFGEGSELTDGLKKAIDNGVNTAYLYGVAPATQAVTNESASAVSSYTLGNDPIIEDLAEITIEEDTTADGTGDTAIATEFRYDDGGTVPGSADTAFIDPHAGQVEFDASGDYYIDYKYYDWSSALDSANTVVNEGETGCFFALSEAESVASLVSGKATQLRDPDYRMVKGWSGAQPNANTSEATPNPMFDTGTYADSIDNLPMFLSAPSREDDALTTVLGAIGGVAAGNALENPILTDSLTNVEPETGVNDEAKLDFNDRDTLRGSQVIPLKQEGAVELDGEASTDTAENWAVKFQTVRVIDKCILLIREVGKAIRGTLDKPGQDDIAAQEAQGALEQLAQRGLLLPNTGDETNLFVRPVEDTPQGTIELSVGLTPVQAVDTFKTTITIA